VFHVKRFGGEAPQGVTGAFRYTLAPSLEYGGTFGGNCGTAAPAPEISAANCFPSVQYYFTGRYLQTLEGIENATSSVNPIHDFSQQEKGFGYMSAFIDNSTRLSVIMGTAISKFQIPDVPGQPVGQMGNPPVTTAFGISNFDSSQLNENQTEVTHYDVLALQKAVNGFDGQLAYFTRYNALQLTPDVVGDLLLNGIASEVTRSSCANGIQGDGSFQVNPANIIRTGFTVSGEQVEVKNCSIVEPCTVCDGSDNGAPKGIRDSTSKVGWLMGVYVQDEWKITGQLTMNAGLRFDQMYQYVDANQLSPRISFTYGSGLRSGDANISHVAPYAQFNAGITHEFLGWNMKPLTLRFDVVNVFDTIYQIRSGTGIGVFAPGQNPHCQAHAT
jgi:outer membrane receptor protein involved in Fe transport